MGNDTTAILYITQNGFNLAQRLRGLYPNARLLKFKLEMLPRLWSEYKNFIFIMATGIVVRTIAPLIKDKKTDPAVVVLDEKGRHAISLLSGHIGGANQVAREIADFLNSVAVITTASDTGNLVIGIGCNSKTSADEIEGAVKNTLKENNLSFSAIRCIATIDKKGNEGGLVAFAKKYGFEIKTYTPHELNRKINEVHYGISKLESVFKATGVSAVAEPSALLASGANNLLVPKQKKGNVTVAVAVKNSSQFTVHSSQFKDKGRRNSEFKTQNSKLYIIGTGPGGVEHITPYAQQAIRNSDVIVGYSTYLDLIQGLIKDKKVISTGMTQEIERCKKAVELAMGGKTVAVISGGDPGIYAMAGLVFEIIRAEEQKGNRAVVKEKTPAPLRRCSAALTVEVIPGIPALSACAAKLGAPLMHDFACISLSDRLTSWELIEKRLELAGVADFVIVFYNPRSKGRPDHIKKAREIILRHRKPDTPVGIVKSAMREWESIIITDLENMLNYDIDMETTLIIGNSHTFTWHGWMITPRGYKLKNPKS